MIYIDTSLKHFWQRCCYCIVLRNILIHPTRLITMDCDKRVYTSSRQPCWDLDGTLLEPSWNLAGTLLEPCWNLPGTLHAGTFLEPCWNLACKFPGILLEPCWNLPTTLLEHAVTFLRILLQLPNSDPLGFQSLRRGVVPAKCMPWKTERYWNLARLWLEYCWNIAGRLLEWWKLVKPCWPC